MDKAWRPAFTTEVSELLVGCLAEAAVPLDALDELTEAESGPVRDLVRSWADQVGDRARCVTTSRIEGYTGSPLPGAQEVELQVFTPEDAAAAIDAWRLPPAATPTSGGATAGRCHRAGNESPRLAASAGDPMSYRRLRRRRCSLAAVWR